MSDRFREITGTAILGIDTLWGGDVMNPSGTGRFIADSWFSDEPLPPAYTHQAAARVRETGGVSAKAPDRRAIDEYLNAIDIPAAIHGLEAEAARMRQAAGPAPGDKLALRSEYLYGLAICFEAMWDLAMEVLGNGAPAGYERCVVASTGHAPEPSNPEPKRERVAQLLAGAGYPSRTREELLAAVDAWRKSHLVPMASIKMMGATAIAYFDQLCAANLVPFLPAELASVPRANIEFQPIKDAWFSGSMNYLGRERNAGGSPRYEANYEINASLEMSYPEFLQLVSHEVVPGHVTTFAYLQNLYWRGLAGFEATVLTMNTRAAALFEGIANNAILIAHGVLEVADLPGRDMQIGALLALLQDDAKNQSSFLTWGEGAPQNEVAAALRNEYLVSPERADKLSGAWGRHPLLGRMYLPAYRAGTERVADLRRRYAAERLTRVLYGCEGPVDVVTIEKALA